VLVERIRTSEEMFGTTVLTPKRRTVLLGLLGGLGLTLALVGVFGMTAYSVARRTPEIGVRMAFGARPGQVVGTMVRDSAVPIAIGALVGVGGALLATGVIKSFLFGTAPNDPVTLATVAGLLAIVGCLAALVPAMRAAKVDPATSLRTE
jgi:ABC-type antimicrobial peptide transport system permease subunit